MIKIVLLWIVTIIWLMFIGMIFYYFLKIYLRNNDYAARDLFSPFFNFIGCAL